MRGSALSALEEPKYRGMKESDVIAFYDSIVLWCHFQKTDTGSVSIEKQKKELVCFQL